MIKEKTLRLVYLGGSFLALLVLLLWHYSRFDLFGSGLMLGWDTPDYVRRAHETLTIGPVNSILGHSYPQLYVQLLAFVGLLAGNVTLMEKILPLLFALISVYLGFQVAFRISGSVHIAGASAFLQVMSIGFLEVVSNLNRNLMAFAVAWFAILSIAGVWSGNYHAKQIILSAVLMGIVAVTQIETFIVLSFIVVASSLLTRSRRNVMMAVSISAAPLAGFALLLPQFFSVYLGSLQVPIATPRTNVTVSDLIYWTGGSVPAVLLVFLGTCYLMYVWMKKRNALALLTFVWTSVLLGIFLIVGTGITGLSAEFGIRALLDVPSYFLLPFGFMPVWAALSRMRERPKLSLRYLSVLRVARISAPILLLGIMVSSAVIGVSQSQIYFNPYISSTAYNKMVLGLSYIRDNSLGVPIIVMNGGSFWWAGLYREYVGSIVGEHFAYFGRLDNLLQLAPTPSTASYPYEFRMQNYFSISYLKELEGNLSLPSPYIHNSYIRDENTLLSHPILVITPDLYDSPLPFELRRFHLGSGVYVIPPHGLTLSLNEPAANVSTSRDGTATTLSGAYTYLDPNTPNLAIIVVNASRGYQSYNITSFPSSWTYTGLLQGGDPSAPDFTPSRPNGNPAVVGNDPADSVMNWSPVPANDAIQVDSLNKKEGVGSITVQGQPDSYNNVGAVLSFSSLDASTYALIDFWARCEGCSGMAVYLVDTAGAYRLFYGLGMNSSAPMNQFTRYAIPISSPSVESKGFDIHSIASVSFLAFSPTHSQRTLWIDDITFQQQNANPRFVYKGRVLPSDLVEFMFTEKLPGSVQSVANLPVLLYPPVMDILSLTAISFATLSILVFLVHRPRFIVRWLSRRKYSHLWQTFRNRREAAVQISSLISKLVNHECRTLPSQESNNGSHKDAMVLRVESALRYGANVGKRSSIIW